MLADEARIYRMIRDDCEELARKHSDARRTQISDEEIGEVDVEDLIEEETMVVSISHNGYIKRTPASVYRAQRRGGKGIKGAKADEDDPVEHLFVTSTHDYLLFFTSKGKVYWQKVYNLPQLSRESKGRAVVNLLNLAEDEKIADCRAVRDFDKPDHYLMMATRKGLVKKTELKAYSRPLKSGIIAIKLREDDELVDVAITKPNDEVVLATAAGMAIRFNEADARPMGRNTSGVKGITLTKDDQLVGMVVADPEATLLTACLNGYGKRTPFGPNAARGRGLGTRAGEVASASPAETPRRGRRVVIQQLPLPHPKARRQGPARHQDHRAQRPGDRHRARQRRRRADDDDRPRQDSARESERLQPDRPQHARRANHVAGRRRHAGGNRVCAERGARRRTKTAAKQLRKCHSKQSTAVVLAPSKTTPRLRSWNVSF